MDERIDYKITASQLNAFSWYLRNEKEDAEQELLDTINRIPSFSTEAQAKGKCFEYLVNQALKKDSCVLEVLNNFDIIKVFYSEKNEAGEKITFTGRYNVQLLFKIIDYLQKFSFVLQQQFLSNTIKIGDNIVELYGYADYVVDNAVIDLKTTANYEYPKYLTNWQRYVYLYCMINDAELFEFHITNFDEIYSEKYTVADTDFSLLSDILAQFIEFLEKNKDKITDKKIFGGEKERTEEFSTEIIVKGGE